MYCSGKDRSRPKIRRACSISASDESIGITMKTGSPVKLIIRKTMIETAQSTTTIWIRRLMV